MDGAEVFDELLETVAFKCLAADGTEEGRERQREIGRKVVQLFGLMG